MENLQLLNAKEKISYGTAIPQVIFYDLSGPKGKKDFRRALRAAVPWQVTDRRTAQTAQVRGVYQDKLPICLEDLAALDKPKDYYKDRLGELEKYVRTHDTPRNYVIAEFPWHHNGRFLRIPRGDDFDRIVQSRNTGIISEAAQQGFREQTIGIAGAGAGASVGLEAVRGGAKQLIVVDGGTLKPHDGNRQWGSLTRGYGTNHAIHFGQEAFDLNPYLRLECVPYNLGLEGEQGTYSLERFVDTSDIIFDEMDSLEMKARLRYLAREMKKPVFQATDLGTQVVIQFDNPNSSAYPCNGRLTPKVYQEILAGDINFERFTQLALEVFIGRENLPESFINALQITQERRLPFLPQSGIAASKAGAESVITLTRYFDGHDIPPERLVA